MARKSVIKPRVKPCADCPTLITAKATRCAPCHTRLISTDPDIRQRCSEKVTRFFRDNPGRASENARRAAAARMANPEQLQRARAAMRAIQPLSCTPEAMAKRDHVARSAVAEERRMAWCPKEYRPLYAALMRKRDMRAHYAKDAVLGQIATDAKRLIPARPPEPQLSPFERQERALQAGAQIVAKVRVTTTEAHPLLAERAA